MKLLKSFAYFSLALLLWIPASFSQDIEDVAYSIHSPEELASWLSRDFLYQWKMPDRAQGPQETLDLGAGDCEDFAILSSSILTRLGIPNEVLVIQFAGLNISHAICIWKGKNGKYSFMSNRELYRTGENTVQAAVKKFYPDYSKIVKKHARIYSRF